MIRYSNHLLFGESPISPLTLTKFILAADLMKGGFKLLDPNEVMVKRRPKLLKKKRGRAPEVVVVDPIVDSIVMMAEWTKQI